MDLSTTQQILVIVLSATLALFLILAIAIAVMVLRLVKTLRAIASRAEKIVETAGSAASLLKNTAGPVGLLHFAQSVFKVVTDHKKNKGED